MKPIYFCPQGREQYRLFLPESPYRQQETVEFDRLALPDKAKSKRVRYTDGASYQAVRSGCLVTIKEFGSRGKLQRHMQMHFCARDWPKRPYAQADFAERLVTEMAKRVFGEEWAPEFRRQADAIIKAVHQVIEV